MKAVTPAIAGYFSGYTWKMHPIGERQIKQLREDMERRVAEVGLPILTGEPRCKHASTSSIHERFAIHY